MASLEVRQLGRGTALELRADGFIHVAFPWGRAFVPLADCLADAVRGNMEKKGERGSWQSGSIKERFFVLEPNGGQLFYYASSDDFSKLGAPNKKLKGRPVHKGFCDLGGASLRPSEDATAPDTGACWGEASLPFLFSAGVAVFCLFC